MKFENTQVFNIEGALRGMRNPMDSWDKSDSHLCDYYEDCIIKSSAMCGNDMVDYDCYIIGEKDLNLAQKLIKAGGEHRKFLRQIFISVDISAPRFWWSEFETYKIGTVSNSCSTMHKLSSYPITNDMFEYEALDDFDEEYWFYTIKYLENLRLKYIETKDYSYFRRLKQVLPESFIQKRTITMNYENVLNIIHQRKNHSLKEWSKDFIEWTKELPYAEELLYLEVK